MKEKIPLTSEGSTIFANFQSMWLTYALFAVIAVQWILFSLLVQHAQNEASISADKYHSPPSVELEAFVELKKSRADILNSTTAQKEQPLVGVFATVVFRAPKWMHLRYTLMVHNAIANLPRDGTWKVQLFLNREWVEKEMFPWHPGFRRLLLNNSQIIVTDLPSNLTKGRPRDILLSRWFYQSLEADHVLMFTANGAFCGNHPQPDMLLTDLVQSVDYCGAPWHRGQGGDGGSHSFRNRKAFLQILEYAEKNNKPFKASTEYVYFQNLMQQMNNANLGAFRVASEEQTQDFGGVHSLSSSHGLTRLPLVVSGTQARLKWEERESLLKHCPEVKMIFPSLHEPACFGAHPVAEKCRTTICALGNIPAHGC